MTNPHPSRCWHLPGHERCALEHAAVRAVNVAAHATGRVALFRAALDSESIDPAVLDLALQQLDSTGTREWSQHR